MPLASLADFWSLLGRTRLVEPEAVAALEQEHAARPEACGGGDPKGVAAWLVDRGVLTRWQAKRVGIGNEGPFFLGDYRLLERHDRDGDSLLFTARHEPSGKHVSVVLLNAKRCRRIDVWTEIVQRTTAATRSTDPLLSRTWSLEQHEASRFVVCELIEGTNLADELERLGPLPEVQAGVLVSQLARSVAAMHDEDRVHGDLSLDALRREPPPGGVARTGRVRLLQFPLAGDPHRVPLRPWRIEDDAELAALGRRAAFVAPELAVAGSVCDPRCDVYALGAILYALLAGRPPCQGRTPEETLKTAGLTGPEPIGGTVGEAMKELVGYLMARDPDARYQTAGEAADAIAACIGLAPAPAQPSAGRPKKKDSFIDVGAPVPLTEDGLPDFSRPAATRDTPVDAAGGDSAAVREFRRRAARLRLIGGGVTLAVLAVTGTLVAYRFGLFEPARERTEVAQAASTERRPVIPWPKADDEPTADDRPGDDTGSEMPGDPAPPVAAVTPDPVTPPPKPGAEQVAARQLIVDDDTLPWASPTSGPPPRLPYLPPGSQLILLGRPAALAADPEGQLFLRSLGPVVESALATLAGFAGCDVAEVESVQAGWQAGGPDEVLGGYVVRLVEGRTVVADEAARLAAWGPTKPKQIDEETVHVGKPFSFWVPAADQGRVLVVVNDAAAPAGMPPGLPASGGPASGGPGGGGPPPLPGGDSLIAQIVRQAAALRDRSGGGVQAELPLELEKLVTMLDADRHVTLLGSPHYLLNTGRVVLAGSLAKLADPIDELFGESLKGAAISVHFADHCYLELDAVAALDVKPDALAGQLTSRLEGLATKVEEYCALLDPSPYGRVLVMRLPTMIRMLVANMRSGPEAGGAVINALLPRHAGHNLALATELALAQSPGAAVVAAPTASKPPAAAGALDRLKQPITLVFARDTLEKSIQMISEEIGVPMEILGSDLQLEGITQNQSFGLEERDKPAEAILRVILEKANPDGKLVFVVRKEAAGEKVYVTTRAAAEKRGETLPPGFEPAAGDDKKKKKP